MAARLGLLSLVVICSEFFNTFVLFNFNVLFFEKLSRGHHGTITEIKVFRVSCQDIIGIGIDG